MAVDAEGRIFALEAKEQEVRVFSPDGSHLRTIGRPGEGPGEFQRANGVALTPDGTVWVYSPAQRRLVEFGVEGEFIRHHTVQANSYGWLWTGGIDSLGVLHDVQFLREDTASVMRLVRTHTRSEVADTLPMPECPVVGVGYYSFPSGSMTIPYGSGRITAVDPRGTIWCGDTRDLTLHEYRMGEVEPYRTLSLVLTPEPVTAAERDSAIAGVEEFKKRAGEANPDYSLIGSTKPIVEGVTMDDVGRVWVRARTVDGFRLIGFGTDGQPLAQVSLPVEPTRYGPLLVRNDRVYFTTADAFDVPSIVSFRLRQ
jgi:hypothetical protein